MEFARIAKGRRQSWQGCVLGGSGAQKGMAAPCRHPTSWRAGPASSRGEAAMPQERPRVVIAGAGFGGLEAAKALRSAAADVIVIDQQNHHCFQPLLYQVATAALSPANVAWPIRSILRKQGNATVLMAEIRGIDTGKRIVHTDSSSLPYDFLVLATGATHSYFGHDE